MIIITLVRLIGTITDPDFLKQQGNKMFQGLSVTWATYWSIIEACVAVMMASAIVIRSVFIQRDRDRGSDVVSFEWVRRRFNVPWSSNSRVRNGGGVSERGNRRRNMRLPSLLTGATLRGMRSFIGRESALEKSAAGTGSTTASEMDLKEWDYHTMRREEAGGRVVDV
jgi:hypothetical protein